MALIHVNGRSYQLEATDDNDLVEVARTIQNAVDGGAAVTLRVLIEGGKVNLYLRTSLIDVIAFDWDGTGAGFFH